MATLIKVVLVLAIMMVVKFGVSLIVRLQKWCLLQTQFSILEKAPLIEGPLARDAKRRDRASSPLTVLNLSNSWPFYANLGIFRIFLGICLHIFRHFMLHFYAVLC